MLFVQADRAECFIFEYHLEQIVIIILLLSLFLLLIVIITDSSVTFFFWNLSPAAKASIAPPQHHLERAHNKPLIE